MYTLHATFDAHVDQEETLAAVLEVLPTGSAASIKREPVLLDVPDLTDAHVGSSIRARIGEGGEFGGVLEHIYPGENGGVLLIVDGKPHSLRFWEALQVIPPVTVGEHTADEPEVEEAVEAEFSMTPDDYNNAVELAVQTEMGLADYLLPLGWITRVAVESVAGEELSDEDFQTIALAARNQMGDLIDGMLGPVLAQKVAALNAFKEANDVD